RFTQLIFSALGFSYGNKFHLRIRLYDLPIVPHHLTITSNPSPRSRTCPCVLLGVCSARFGLLIRFSLLYFFDRIRIPACSTARTRSPTRPPISRTGFSNW